MSLEIIDGKCVQESCKEMVKKRLCSLTAVEILRLILEGKLHNTWYSTSTLTKNGQFSDVTYDDLKNIEQIYRDGGRLVVLDSDLRNVGHFSLVPTDLYDDSRFVIKKYYPKRS